MTGAAAEAIPAATLVLFRRPPGGADGHLPDEHLVVQRAAAMAFAAGAIVFPGGRIDPADHALAAAIGGADDPIELAARIAAIRETIEEAGIAIGIEPEPDAACIIMWRAALARGEPLAALLGDRRIMPERLIPFARWRAPANSRRRFDTRFFIARAPADVAPIADGGESVRAFWADAETLLADVAIGRHHVIFPTLRNLERLATLRTFDAAVSHLQTHPVRIIAPHIEERGDERWLCIPEDAGYPVTAQPIATAHRG